MIFEPGTGGSITANTLENQFYTLIRQVHDVQRDTANKNPNGADILDSSVNEDDLTCSGSINLYIEIDQAAGTSSISYPDPYIDAGWIEGSEGDGSASNFNHALAERIMRLVLAERDPAQEITELKFSDPSIEILDEPLSTPCVHNARLKTSFTIELESVSSSTGSHYKAKEYLD